MADDDFQTLMNAREALVAKRLTWAQTIAATGDVPENTIQSIVEIQRAIEVVDMAIEELEQAELDKELEEDNEGDDP